MAEWRAVQLSRNLVDDTSEKIDDLISADQLVIKHRSQNLKLLAGMNFA